MRTDAILAPVSWRRMIRAVEKVRERLPRAVRALEAANVSYAVAGGNAVAAWVSRADEAAVRNTPDVDILLRRSDLKAGKDALQSARLEYRVEGCVDRADPTARDAVHIVFASEKVHSDSIDVAPDVSESEAADQFRLVTLDALVRMKLTAFRDKDRTHLRDLIEVGLLDNSMLDKLSPELASRLQLILNTPEG